MADEFKDKHFCARYDISDTWDWLRKLPHWAFNKISIELWCSRHRGEPLPAHLESWEVDEEGIPWFVMLECKGTDTSRNMAIAWDDHCVGLFAYRDWTNDGLPFVGDEELYWSGFWFERLEDAKRFQKAFGGMGTWQEGYEEFAAACNRRRHGEEELEGL